MHFFIAHQKHNKVAYILFFLSENSKNELNEKTFPFNCTETS